MRRLTRKLALITGTAALTAGVAAACHPVGDPVAYCHGSAPEAGLVITSAYVDGAYVRCQGNSPFGNCWKWSIYRENHNSYALGC